MPARDFFEALWQDPWRMLDGDRLGSSAMAIDMRESDDAYTVEAELPGVRPEDMDITLDGRNLTIRARYSESREEGGRGDQYLVRERRMGESARSVMLPGAVDADAVTTEFENGELRISLPKAPESRARRIPVGPGGGSTKRVGSSG